MLLDGGASRVALRCNRGGYTAPGAATEFGAPGSGVCYNGVGIGLCDNGGSTSDMLLRQDTVRVSICCILSVFIFIFIRQERQHSMKSESENNCEKRNEK